MKLVQKQTMSLSKGIASLVVPPPKLTVSQWADKHRVLSKESSAEHGRWNTVRAPYQREIMEAVNDLEVHLNVEKIKKSGLIEK